MATVTHWHTGNGPEEVSRRGLGVFPGPFFFQLRIPRTLLAVLAS